MQAYLHIGVMKSGTTFLQEAVFPNVVGSDFIGKFHDSVRGIASAHSCYGSDMEQLVNGLTTQSKAAYKLKDAKNQFCRIKKMWTDDGWSGQRFYISFESMTDAQHISNGECLKRIASLFEGDDVSILVTVRNPISAMKSLYVELSGNAAQGRTTYAQWCRELLAQSSARNTPIPWPLMMYRYDFLESDVKKYFPKSRVTFIPMELLQINDLAYAMMLQEAFDIPQENVLPLLRADVGQRYKRSSLKNIVGSGQVGVMCSLNRILGRYFPGFNYVQARLFRGMKEVLAKRIVCRFIGDSEAVDKELAEFFRPGVMRIRDSVNCDFESLGYPLSYKMEHSTELS